MAETTSAVAGIDPKYLYNTSATKTATKGKSDMDKDAFLNLLVTQLKYQDPMNPTNDKEFISQMAQFSSLEQMQNLNTTSSKMMGYSLMNKIVQADVKNETTGEIKSVTGTVDGVRMDAGKTYLNVNGNDVNLSDVKTVADVSNELMLQKIDTLNKSITDLKTEVTKLKSTATAN